MSLGLIVDITKNKIFSHKGSIKLKQVNREVSIKNQRLFLFYLKLF